MWSMRESEGKTVRGGGRRWPGIKCRKGGRFLDAGVAAVTWTGPQHTSKHTSLTCFSAVSGLPLQRQRKSLVNFSVLCSFSFMILNNFLSYTIFLSWLSTFFSFSHSLFTCDGEFTICLNSQNVSAGTVKHFSSFFLFFFCWLLVVTKHLTHGSSPGGHTQASNTCTQYLVTQ